MSTSGATTSPKPAPDAAMSGLDGVVVARTELSDVNGLEGRLTIRGYDVEELAGRASFEEVTHLLWHGLLPSSKELTDFRRQIASYRRLPDETRAAIRASAKRMAPMD